MVGLSVQKRDTEGDKRVDRCGVKGAQAVQ